MEPMDLSKFDRCPLCDSNLRTCETRTCPHAEEAKRWEHEAENLRQQITDYTTPGDEEREELKRLREAVKWALNEPFPLLYESHGEEWSMDDFKADLRRRVSGKEGT